MMFRPWHCSLSTVPFGPKPALSARFFEIIRKYFQKKKFTLLPSKCFQFRNILMNPVDGDVKVENKTGEGRPPFPKRKVAIMMGFCGTAYQGMQL